ncbi:hypothetical protein [Geomonas azotofigens]|uniref:hypothetical protein n=1 Tax=Geomonas azotofigens TaxID=2843196 RepID=UPI001C0F49F6|nr:hypothetical protein [Geomonas azotofigens]MBU5614120.1 hypothetical protein [Geomonas azotofigens]
MHTKVQPEEVRDSTKEQADEAREPSGAATDQPDEARCRTQSLVSAFSMCLLKKRSCPYAMSFGHQYLCRHPNHTRFLVPSQKPKK